MATTVARPNAAPDTGTPAQLAVAEMLRIASPTLIAHHRRVSAMSALLARRLGLDETEAREIGRAGSLHDIGMALLPQDLLDRQSLLSVREKEMIHQHSAWGHDMLAMEEDPALSLAARVALEHHERWDGSGYPFGLKGEEICLAARIIAVCAVYDALRHPRRGKSALDHDGAIAVLCHGDDQSGPDAFDPRVREVFVRFGEDFRRIAENRDGIAMAA